MSNLRKLAHLQEQLGDEQFAALIDSGNTGKVKAFCDNLVKDAMPTEITVGDRTYDILGFLKGNETSVLGHTMAERAKEMNANLGQDDGQYLLYHQGYIPVSLRGKVIFVFTDWRHPSLSGRVVCVCWVDGRWARYWGWLAFGWRGVVRMLRRK